MPPNLYFRQLLAGRDFARRDPIARQMVNFVYLIGDRETGSAVAVDLAYAPAEVLTILEEDGMHLEGTLATHYHADHVGGDIFGLRIAGLTDLLEIVSVPVYVQRDELEYVSLATGLGRDELTPVEPGAVIQAGEVAIECIHTPGHTPGSQCFLVEGRLVAGDTLFLQGCGRTDLPGGDPEALYDSLFKTLARVSDDTVLYPGHLYSDGQSATMGATRRSNYVLAPRAPAQWLAMFGG